MSARSKMPATAKKGTISGSRETMASLRAELAEMREERNLALWLYRELEYKVKAAVLKQMMEQPEVKEQMINKMIAQQMAAAK